MRGRYKCGGVEFVIEVVDVNDSRLSIGIAEYIKASNLKILVQYEGLQKIYITATMPDVFMRFVFKNHETPTYCVQYRPFLSFAAQLERIESPHQLDWREVGF